MIEKLHFTRLDHFVRKLIPSVTIVLLTLHLILGCCWHHEHACKTPGASGGLSATARARAPCPCDAHHKQNGSLGASGGLSATAAATNQHTEQDHRQPQPGRNQCDHGSCVFLRMDGMPVLEWISQHLNITFATPPAPALTTVSASYLASARSFHYPASLPLRLHLIHQILLI